MSRGDSKRCDSMKKLETSKVVYEGWMVRCGRRKIGRSYIHMRYFVLENRLLAYYKRKPQDDMVPVKTLVIDGNCRVEDRGLKTHHGHMVYILCIYNKKEGHQQMTMAAFNIQEALLWKEKIELVIDWQQELFSAHGTKSLASFKSGVIQRSIFYQENQVSTDDEDEGPGTLVRRTTIGNGPPTSVFDWTQLESNQNNNDHSSSQKYWRLVRCQNGLRIFEELSQVDNLPRSCSRAMKAVGVVEATCDEIFERIMCMDETRFEWDCSFQYGNLVEEVDGHTAILYHQLLFEWFPLLVWPRDLCYLRYWRRNDNGSYVVLFRSRELPNCGPRAGFVRAHIESGGFNISPLKLRNGKPRSKVQHLMQIDLKGWGVGNISSFQYHCLIRMLSSVAGLREWFSQTDDVPRVSRIPVIANMESASLSTRKDQKLQEATLRSSPSANHRRNLSKNSMMMDEDSDEDEDFQFLETEASFSKLETDNKLAGLEEDFSAQIDVSCFSGNLLKDERENGRNCWKTSEGKNFKVRGKKFAFDRKNKVSAGKHVMQLVAVDWFKDSKRMDHVARRPGCAAQVASEQGLFSLIINLQIPGSTNYSIVCYMVAEQLVSGSLLQQFFDGDDEFRNSRLKLIPAVPKGSWIVRQSIGSAACLLGKTVDCMYIRRPNYLEIDVDIGSSTVANGVLGLVLGIVTTLVVDMAFLIQGNTVEELPEQLLTAVRISHIELSAAVVPVFSSETCAD